MRRRNSNAIATTNNDAWGFSNNLYGRFFFCILFCIRWPYIYAPTRNRTWLFGLGDQRDIHFTIGAIDYSPSKIETLPQVGFEPTPYRV